MSVSFLDFKLLHVFDFTRLFNIDHFGALLKRNYNVQCKHVLFLVVFNLKF